MSLEFKAVNLLRVVMFVISMELLSQVELSIPRIVGNFMHIVVIHYCCLIDVFLMYN